MNLKQTIKRILREETTKLDKELHYLIANHKHIDDAINELKTIFNETPKNNKENILRFIEQFLKGLDVLFRQIFINAKYCESTLGLLNESRLKRILVKEDDVDRTGINKFYDYFNYMVKLYYQIEKSINEIKNTSTSDKETLKSNINNYYQLIYKDNNSMFELIKYINQLLENTYNDITSNKTTKRLRPTFRTQKKSRSNWQAFPLRIPLIHSTYLSPL